MSRVVVVVVVVVVVGVVDIDATVLLATPGEWA